MPLKKSTRKLPRKIIHPTFESVSKDNGPLSIKPFKTRSRRWILLRWLNLEYCQSNHRTERTVASPRKQYRSMNHSKPTMGDPDCSSHIRRAKRLARDIEGTILLKNFSPTTAHSQRYPGPAARSTMPPPLLYTNTLSNGGLTSPHENQGSARN